jgi:hypothetical protein
MRLHGFVDPRHMTLDELRLLRLLLLPQLQHRLSLTTVELGAAKRRAVTLPPSISIERLIAHDAAWPVVFGVCHFSLQTNSIVITIIPQMG